MAVLIGLIVSVCLLIAYCVYQRRRLAFAKHKHVKSRILKYLKMRALGRLLDDQGKPNTDVLEKLFASIDSDEDGKLSHSELKALVVGMRLYEINLNEDDAVNKVMKDFDTSGNEVVEHDEFIAGIGKWLEEAMGS
ncbi:hypothetical protein M8C21_002227, partial [Ambrosia artemisiifolia]